ncbi:Aminopeptidase N [Frankliniella fusca]|uniref:Aminopeptidase N n=1 Tax=Frankliniella fusca TaxID=407009 RepID=A0AAE1HX31_9NEOP|nr:Aminopeptidase N [Frankliniella fusca]
MNVTDYRNDSQYRCDLVVFFLGLHRLRRDYTYNCENRIMGVVSGGPLVVSKSSMSMPALLLLLAVAVAVAAPALAVPLPRESSPAPRSPLDLLDDRTRVLAPDMADPLPPARIRSSKRASRVAVRADANGDPYRLPSSLIPLVYQVELTPDFNSFTFQGSALIIVNCVEDTYKIVLHAKELDFDSTEFYIVDDRNAYFPIGDISSVKSWTLDKVHDFLTIELNMLLTKGNRYRFIFAYTGKLNDDLDGFYRSSYKTADGETRWLATTQFEETGARRAFPCWDEPSFKARFYIIIDHDQTRSAVSNMPIVSSQLQDTGLIQVQFDGTLPISTYLVAFIVSDFGSVTNCEGNFTLYARKELLEGGHFSQVIGQRALQLLAEYNGIDYMLPKEDQAAIPDFAAGAMENWGLVTYREEYLIEQDSQTIRIAEYMMTTICHELGHQWTGDLVTLDWWSHTWLNEGFADYFENYICDLIKPEWHLRDKGVVYDHQQAMENDVIASQHAMSSPVSTPAEDSSKFDRISYSKGGAVIRMWEYMLGVDVLKAGMHRYLSVHMFKNTQPADLFGAIDFEVKKAKALPEGVSFGQIASTWTEQPGVPVVSAVRDYDKKTLTLSQQRFFYATPNPPSLLNQRWFIPVTIAEQSSADWTDAALKPTTWMRPDDKQVVQPLNSAANEWVLVNPKEIGYYRVNYDTKNWNMLAQALTSNPSSIPSASRSQLLNDALALARGNQLDYSVALPFLNFLKMEHEVAPWQTATASLNFLRSKLAGTGAWNSFLSVVRKLTQQPYDFVGYGGAPDHETRYLRYYVVSYACYAGNEDCISQANNRLKSWLADSNTKLDSDTAAVSWCYGLRGADGSSNFAGLKAKWMATTDPDTRATLVSYLACGKSNDLTSLLTETVSSNSKVTQEDVVALWKAVLNRPEQVPTLLKFAQDNYKQVDAYFSASGANGGAVKLLVNCIEAITSTDAFNDARRWVENNYKGQTDSYNALQTAFLSAYEQLDWYRKHYQTVADWLSRNA